MGRYDDETGEKRVFYIDAGSYGASVHSPILCTECHSGLDRIPHSDTGNVDCAQRCHMLDSTKGQKYSHTDMSEKYDTSVHGKGPVENPKPFPEDFPTCQYCHDNTLPGALDKSNIKALSKETDIRHVWARRTQRKIIELCASCHKDGDMMARHDIESIDTLKDTFHWEMIKYGVKDAPDCISCHVPAGYSSHDMRPDSDPFSSIHILQRVKTCSGKGGAQTCHPDATPDFAEGKIHAYGMKAQLLTKESVMDAGQRFKSLMLTRTKEGLVEDEVLTYYILEIIKLFYKILIGGVIGFMILHQLLEYRRARKKHKGH